MNFLRAENFEIKFLIYFPLTSPPPLYLFGYIGLICKEQYVVIWFIKQLIVKEMKENENLSKIFGQISKKLFS